MYGYKKAISCKVVCMSFRLEITDFSFLMNKSKKTANTDNMISVSHPGF